MERGKPPRGTAGQNFEKTECFESMVLKHHTLNPFDRKPQGAVATGGQVRLRLTVEDEQAPVELFLRVWNGDERRYPMRPLGLKDGRMIYEAQIGVGDKPRLLWYRFECEYKGEHVVLGAPGDHTGCGEGVMGSEESFQLTVYDAAYDTPAWMRDGVMYQIMVDRFCHGEGTDALMHAKDGQNIILHEDWNEMPFLNIAENGDNFANDFFGGNLEGVRQKLPYLKQLGVSVLYFNPIFCARTNHKYDTSDYRRVDPMFGDEQALTRLCKEAEALGMRVMLDGVFSHVGDDSLYFNRRGTYGEHVGAYRDPDSPYYKWFTFRHWPDDYECWWGFKTLPNVNEMDEDYRRFILEDDDSVVRHWVRKGTSGWRLDVAADLGHSPEFNHKFWKEFRRVVKEANPEAIILAEHYGDAMSWLQGDEWDTVMNYDAFMEPVSWFLTGMEKHSDEFNQGLLGNSESFIGAMTYHMPAFYAPSLYTAMNELDNHDHSRFLTRTNHRVGRVANVGPYAAAENTNKAVLREAVVIQMTWPGAPTLYYGDEAGQVGFTDPDNRRTYPWGQEDQELIRFYKEMIAVHRRFPVLAMGSLKFLYHDYNVLSYGRFNQEEQVIVVINNRNERVHVEIPVWLTGINRLSLIHI